MLVTGSTLHTREIKDTKERTRHGVCKCNCSGRYMGSFHDSLTNAHNTSQAQLGWHCQPWLLWPHRHTIQGELLFFRNEVKKKTLANHRAGNAPRLRLSHRNLPEPEVQHVPSSLRNRARTVQAGTVTIDTVAAMSASCCVFLRSKKATF